MNTPTKASFGVSVALAVILLGAAACGATDDRAPASMTNSSRDDPAPSFRLADVLDSVGTVTLQESIDVINVHITVRMDPSGGFLVADGSEQQIRRYSQDGTLIWNFGHPGLGPDEFESPVVAVRLTRESVLARDRLKTVLYHEPSGTLRPLTPSAEFVVSDVDVVDSSTVLYSGRFGAGDADRGLIRRVALSANERITASFFTPYVEEGSVGTATSTGWVQSVVRNDTVAAVFSLSDTVYLFDSRGTALKKIPLPTDNFLHVPRNADALFRQGRVAVQEALAGMSLIVSLAWLPSGDFLVQYGEMTASGEGAYHLIGMRLSGAGVFEISEAPLVLVVDEREGVLYYQSPNVMTMEKWVAARLRL